MKKFTWMLISLTLVLAACSTTGRGSRNTSHPPTSGVTPDTPLRVGMSQADVKQAWGDPRDVLKSDQDPKSETWIYERKRGAAASTGGGAVILRTLVRLTFSDGRLEKIDEQPL